MKDDKKQKQMLCNELLLHKLICKHDFQENPRLYKVNNISEAEMKVNLGILFSGEHDKESNQQIEIPNQTEILGTFETYAKLKESDPLAVSAPLDEPCAVIWNTPHGRKWYTGLTRSIINEDSLVKEYLECTDKNSSKTTWQYPQKEDEQIMETIQIIRCNVIGAWDMTLSQGLLLKNGR